MPYGNFRRDGDRGGDRGGSGGFRRFNRGPPQGPREMHKITCSECGKEAEVPFVPREGSPVYCKDCFMKKKGITPREQTTEPSEERREETASASEEPKEETASASEEESEESSEEDENEEEY